MTDIDWTRHPAEACTDLGADDDTIGDGGMVGRLIIAICTVFGCLAAVHAISWVLL